MESAWRIYILAFISFLVGTSQNIITGILDQIASSLHITVYTAGQLITVYSLVYAIGTPVLIALTAKWDRRKLILSGLAVFTAANLLIYLLPGFEWFLAARIVMALGAGTVVVTALSMAAKIAPPGKQASSIATVIMGFTASLIIGVPIGRIVSSALGWKTVFLGIVIVGIIGMLVVALTIPRVKGDAPVPLVRQISLLKSPKVALGLAITFLWCGGYSIAYTYISPYLLEVKGMNGGLISSALLAFGIASLIGSKLGGYSTDKKGISFTLLSGMLLHIVSLILLSISGHSILAVLGFLVLWSFSAWTTGPTQQFNLVSLKPEASSVMLSLNQSTMQLAMAAGAALGGVAAGSVSLSSVTWFGAAGVALAAGAVLLLSRMQAGSTPVSKAAKNQPAN
ncbi:MFS transporter [Metabacillus sp. GX 13764]|uniref:MFS transporter n=1 Tax=Metabacillus kandeliae TaxID=2900151 RepID=UPI001E5C12BB|nr:MFS transporter [Metabacillus kandeliae]MCD7035401.1 MFS transporter [Metabacillus kandeliae]